MSDRYVEQNIEITPLVRQYIKDSGYDVGMGLSRERTIYGESYREQFTTDADLDTAIQLILESDEALHYDGEVRGKHVIRNGNPRLVIMVDPRGNYQLISVLYRPLRRPRQRYVY